MSGVPDLSVLMKSVVPRERAGSQTQARYDFQANFGILKLVELRESGRDFRIVFDIFDDLMVVDSASAPTQACFYQLKSKDPGDWTIPDVCKKIGAQIPRSIISRLYAHVASFGAAVAETGLVSNAAYKLKLLDGSTTSGAHHRIGGAELHPDEVQKVAAAVGADIHPADVPSWLPKLAFIRTTLGVHGQELRQIFGGRGCRLFWIPSRARRRCGAGGTRRTCRDQDGGGLEARLPKAAASARCHCDRPRRRRRFERARHCRRPCRHR